MKTPMLSMFRETNFKETELGPLPEDWQAVRLGEIVRMKQGKVLPTSRLTTSGFPVFGANGLIGFYHNYTHDETEVLVTCRGSTCGTVNISPPRSFITNNAMIITPLSDSKLTKQYLAFALTKSDRSSTITGTGQPQITKGKLGLIPIPLPPLPEQKAIAYVLRTVQQAKEATEKVIAALKNLKKSLMRHLFTYGPVPLDKVDSVPLRETELGPLPEHWQVVRLREVAHIIMGQSPPSRTYNLEKIGFPFLQGKAEFTELYPKPIKWCSDPKRICPANSILISVRAPVGDVNIAELEYCIGRGLAAICPKSLSDMRFLFYWLILNKSSLEEQSSGTTFKSVNRNVLENIRIPLPPLPEQQEIARILQAVDKRIQAEEAYVRALNDLFKTLLNELMTGRIRVKFLAGSEANEKL